MADSQLLAPWEYEGERPQVIEEGELIYNGWPIRFEWLRKDERHHRFLWRYIGDDGSWTLPMGNIGEFPDEKLVQYIANMSSRGLIWREFRFNSEILQISPNGNGQWLNADSSTSRFVFRRVRLCHTSSRTYNRVMTLLSNPSSDITFAHEFGRMSQAEKWKQIFGFATDDELSCARVDMNTLCSYALSSFVTLWNQQPILKWRLASSHTSTRKQLSPEFYVCESGQSKWRSATQLKGWAKAIKQFGPLRPQRGRVCLNDFFIGNPTLAYGELTAPSYHEQLEARLELRRWAREHLPPDVWAEIERCEN